jgi:hypothetical protein
LTAFRASLRSSRLLIAALLAGHGLATGCSWVALPALAAAIVTSGLAVSLLAAWRAMLGTARVLELRPDGSAMIEERGERTQTDVLDARAPVWWLATMRLRPAGSRPFWLVLLPDSTDAESFRRLRVWIAVRGPAAPDSTRPESRQARENPTPT